MPGTAHRFDARNTDFRSRNLNSAFVIRFLNSREIRLDISSFFVGFNMIKPLATPSKAFAFKTTRGRHAKVTNYKNCKKYSGLYV